MDVAIDVGYGHVKAVSAAGLTARFPAVYAPEPPDAAWGDTFDEGTGEDQVIWTPREGPAQPFWVGAAARRRPGARRPWADAAVDRGGYVLLVDAALSRILPRHDTPWLLDVAVGLPLALFAQHKAALHHLLSDHQAKVAVGRSPAQTWEFRSVTVMPQAAGAYYAARLRPGSTPEGEGLTAVIDIGYRTTDYLVLEPTDRGGVRPVKTLSGSFDWGLVQVTESVRQWVVDQTGRLADPLRVESALAGHPPRFRDHGTSWDLTEPRTRFAALLADQIVDGLRGVWGPALAELSTVLLAGGGASWTEAAFRQVWPDVVLVDDPVMANARGFLEMLRLKRRPIGVQAG